MLFRYIFCRENQWNALTLSPQTEAMKLAEFRSCASLALLQQVGYHFLIDYLHVVALNILGFLVPPSQIYLLINDNGPIIALSSTEKCEIKKKITKKCDGVGCIIY
jgi:hypothetical protein